MRAWYPRFLLLTPVDNNRSRRTCAHAHVRRDLLLSTLSAVRRVESLPKAQKLALFHLKDVSICITMTAVIRNLRNTHNFSKQTSPFDLGKALSLE
ncbi:hypothetical protein KDH_47770 [Dictyobacter sp. S3.2.2.5]|uniref:Uncharacterized protein n=1 Tax=Dictyobacter halimunensis TaxID=3026934 RepID=A0ABQ6FZG9_9CHLR|nr:hypothetical protein KDH_47770 [Dictyobacter sp. S3.2.2.5]